MNRQGAYIPTPGPPDAYLLDRFEFFGPWQGAPLARPVSGRRDRATRRVSSAGPAVGSVRVVVFFRPPAAQRLTDDR